jgi:hypothetical protein
MTKAAGPSLPEIASARASMVRMAPSRSLIINGEQSSDPCSRASIRCRRTPAPSVSLLA